MIATAPSPPPLVSIPPARMRAVIQRSYGTPDVLGLAVLEVPVPGEREVLVQVHAAGLDRGVWHLLTGVPYAARLAFGVRKPRNPVPGLDLAGTVVATGPGVGRFQPGDEVFGIGRGTFAEYAVASEEKLVHKSATLSFEQAAAVPISGLTALQAVLDAGQLQAGQRVLLLGASGGVGSYAVQIAHGTGADVTGVCSTAKVDLVRSLGADVVLDYTATNVLVGAEPYDLIVDMGGHRSVRAMRQALTPRGRLVIVGSEGGDRLIGVLRQVRAVVLSPFVSQTLTMLVSSENRADLERLPPMLANGTLVPAVERSFPLEAAADAMRHLEAGRARGKLVITP